MNKNNYYLLAFGLVVVFICTGIGYQIGLNTKPKPIYVNGKSFAKALKDCDIEFTQDQQKALFEKLRIERGNK